MKFLAKLDGSIICPDQSRIGAYNKFVKKHAGKAVYVEILPPTKKRSNNQNAFLHSVVLPHWASFLAHLGYTKNDTGEHLDSDNTKHHLKLTFLSHESISKTTGKKIVLTKATSKLTSEEFSNFLDEINRLLVDQNFAPLPVPYYTGTE